MPEMLMKLKDGDEPSKCQAFMATETDDAERLANILDSGLDVDARFEKVRVGLLLKLKAQ